MSQIEMILTVALIVMLAITFYGGIFLLFYPLAKAEAVSEGKFDYAMYGEPVNEGGYRFRPMLHKAYLAGFENAKSESRFAFSA